MRRRASRFASSSVAPPKTWTERSSVPTVPISPRLVGIISVLVWDLATGGLVTLEGPAKLTARGVRFSPDGKKLVCMYRPDDDAPLKDSPRSMRIWDLVKRQAVVTIDRLPYGMAARSFFSRRQTPGHRRPV